MSGQSIIGAAIDPDGSPTSEADRRADDEWFERVRGFAFSILLEEYREGAITFESMMRKGRVAVRKLSIARQRSLLGALALEALAQPRRASGRGRPKVSKAMRELTTSLVRRVRECEGLPTKGNAEGAETCYERVSNLLKEFEIYRDAKTIENWSTRRS